MTKAVISNDYRLNVLLGWGYEKFLFHHQELAFEVIETYEKNQTWLENYFFMNWEKSWTFY